MYKIGEVAKILGVKTHTIRFWNKHFPHISPIYQNSKTRYYNGFAFDEFAKIKQLMHRDGMKISGIKQLVKKGGISLRKEVRNSETQPVLFSEISMTNPNISQIRKLISEIKEDFEKILYDKN